LCGQDPVSGNCYDHRTQNKVPPNTWALFGMFG
jgi:hypothetical protein